MISRTPISTHEKTLYTVELAMLTAITAIFSFFMIPAGPFKITLAVIPVVVGAVTLGVGASTFLGATFGICSFIQCFGMDAFGTLLLETNPYFTAIFCIVPRVLVGLIAGLLFHILEQKKPIVSTLTTSLTASVSNTVLVLGTLLLLFGSTEIATMLNLGEISVFALLWALAGVNAVVEAIACTVVGAGLSNVLLYLRKRRSVK